MTLKHPQQLYLPLLAILLLATAFSLTGGIASAQSAQGDDFGIWYVQGTAARPGGFLLPGRTAFGEINACSRGNSICEDRDGFLTYFGNAQGLEMDRSYTISVQGLLPDPKITVSTFYDGTNLEEFADNYNVDADAFARSLGLDGRYDNVQTVPIGGIFARNEPGTSELTFTPVEGDIGAYLISVTGFHIRSTGPYVLSLRQNN